MYMNIHHFLFALTTILNGAYSHKCSWNYRFDSIDNHFNIVYPDDNAVYFGMIIPSNTSNFRILSNDKETLFLPNHPASTYFSIQVYDTSDLVSSFYHVKDIDLLQTSELMDKSSQFNLTVELAPQYHYFALFRIYGSYFPRKDYYDSIYYWAGVPPRTFIDDEEYFLCDINYQQQGNIYTNITRELNTVTGTVCLENDKFQFMEAPPGSLMNADANYMIACIKPNTYYNVSIQVPRIMCSLGYTNKSEHPWINEEYDLRYASLSIISTTAPRPTVTTYVIPCDKFVYTIEIYVADDVPFPGLLYRQLLPNPSFEQSIEYAKKKCYDYVNSIYDIYCIQILMGGYYPQLFPAYSKVFLEKID